jgi:hypothetical protein
MKPKEIDLKEELRQLRISSNTVREKAQLNLPEGHPVRKVVGPLTQINTRLSEVIEALGQQGMVGFTKAQMEEAENNMYELVLDSMCEVLGVKQYDPYDGEYIGPGEAARYSIRSILREAEIMDDDNNFATLTVEDKLDVNDDEGS